MGKSYDYFKTLKEMSSCIADAYLLIVCGKEFRNETIKFEGSKTELSERLMNEFIAPIERNDIYRLSFCLNEELTQIIQISEFILLAELDSFGFVEQIGDLFNNQNHIFLMLKDLKNRDKIRKFVSENLICCNRIKKCIYKDVRASLQSARQPLIRYYVSCMFIELVKNTERAFCEVERVVINNT